MVNFANANMDSDKERPGSVKVDIDEGTQPKKWKFMSDLPKPLTLEEKKYLLAVERGDLANVRRMLQKAHRYKALDINCVDSLGRGSLTLAIDGENLEMVELLVVMGVQTRDALLHSINVEFVEAVELLLEHEELIHKDGEPYSWQTVDMNTAAFTPDITPLILAAHRNNYEILTILLSRGATLPMPHDIKCGCEECIRESSEDSLRHSLSRLNEYRALASPSLIALSSSDPILTSFQLSWELRNLAFAEPECKSEYLELRRQCQQFAVDLLHQSRSSQELAIILNHDPNSAHAYEEGEHMKLTRLELAIQYKQKKFVAHPNIQQLLAAIWYEGVPGFRRKSSTEKLFIIIRTAVLFPLYCSLYLFCPETKTGKLMRKPFMKFLIHASSYLFFLLILILVSQRAEDQLIELFGTESMKQSLMEKYEKQRGNTPAILEYVVLVYVFGFIYEETHEIYTEGINAYLRNMWNFIDFTRNSLYCLVFILRGAAYIQQTQEIAKDPATAYIARENWEPFDPQLIAEGLFAGANIFSALKLVHLFSINPHLGPLQISLGRMVIDIVKFFFIYSLVLFAFACGLNQLLWYFSNLEKNKCYHLANGDADWTNQGESCMKWRRFANVFESSQSLFWASFGLVDLSSFELSGIKTYTRFWGLLMFGSYSVINVIVLLNLLIAMMSNSYTIINEQSDTEWKFARTKLWMSYFEESCTLPPPFNIFPTPKMLLKLLGLRKKDKMRRMSTKRYNKAEKERDYRYTSVMRALVWRYVSAMHRKMEESEVTEDDINEVKGEISSFRYEMLEILGRNGMDISSAEKKEKAVLGKKMKIWERRLMKDFKVAPVATEEEIDDLIYEPAPENEDSLARFRRIAKLAVLNSSMHKWRQVITGACLASQIGHCNSRESFKKQQNLQKAMEEAKKLVTKSPAPGPSNYTPIDLPDMTGSTILEVLKEEGGSSPEFDIAAPEIYKQFLAIPSQNSLKKKHPLSPNVLITKTTDEGDQKPLEQQLGKEEVKSEGSSETEGTAGPDSEGHANESISTETKSLAEIERSPPKENSSVTSETLLKSSPCDMLSAPSQSEGRLDVSSQSTGLYDQELQKAKKSPDLCKSPKNVRELEKYLDEKLKSTKPLAPDETKAKSDSGKAVDGKVDDGKAVKDKSIKSLSSVGSETKQSAVTSVKSGRASPITPEKTSTSPTEKEAPIHTALGKETPAPLASRKITTPPISRKTSPAPQVSGRTTPASQVSGRGTPVRSAGLSSPAIKSRVTTPLRPKSPTSISVEAREDDAASSLIEDTSSTSDGDKKPKKYQAPMPPSTTEEEKYVRKTEDAKSATTFPTGRRDAPEIKLSEAEGKSGTEEKPGPEPERSPMTSRNIRKIEDKPKRIQPKYGWL